MKLLSEDEIPEIRKEMAGIISKILPKKITDNLKLGAGFGFEKYMEYVVKVCSFVDLKKLNRSHDILAGQLLDSVFRTE